MIKRIILTSAIFFFSGICNAGKLWERVFYDMPVSELKEIYQIEPLSEPFAGYSDYSYKDIKILDERFKVIFEAAHNQVKEVSLKYDNPSNPDTKLFGKLSQMLSEQYGPPKSYEKGHGCYEIYEWRLNELVVMLTIRKKDITIRYTQSSSNVRKYKN